MLRVAGLSSCDVVTERGSAASLGGGEAVRGAEVSVLEFADDLGKTLIAPLGFLRFVGGCGWSCLDDDKG